LIINHLTALFNIKYLISEYTDNVAKVDGIGAGYNEGDLKKTKPDRGGVNPEV